MSTLSVTTLEGLASSPTPTKIEVASGHTLLAPGHVIQTVDFTHGTEVATTSTSYVSSGLQGIITPKFSNSKIYCNFYQHFRVSGDHDHGIAFKVNRTIGATTTEIYTPAQHYEYYFYDGTANATNDERHDRFPIFVVDTPNSTSACTYAVTFRSMRTSDNSNTKAQVDGNKSMGFLMEIAQ